MRKLLVLLVAICGLVIFAPLAGAQSVSYTVQAWGRTLNDDSPTPIPPSPLPDPVTQMVTTNADTFVLEDGTVYAAGANASGDLGNGTTSSTKTTTFSRVKIPGKEPIQSLAFVGGDGTMMALGENRDVYGWGYNKGDELCIPGEKIPSTSNVQKTPVDLTAAGDVPAGVTMMAAAGDHATYYVGPNATVDPNTLWSCGNNGMGDLGNDSTAPSSQKVEVEGFTDPDDSPVVSMTASWSDEGVLLSDGTYWAWGDNAFGQLGYSTTTRCTSGRDSEPCSLTANEVKFPPVTTGSGSLRVIVPTNPLVDNTVTMGGGGPQDGQTMALVTDGTNDYYYGWGNDREDQLCDGGLASKYTSPTNLSGDNKINEVGTLEEVASGGEAGYLLTKSGAIYSCGQDGKNGADDGKGELGNGKKYGGVDPSLTEVIDAGVQSVSSTQYNVDAVKTATTG
jgi:alpha-tubulin suppressor-like RCC1 family protein